MNKIITLIFYIFINLSYAKTGQLDNLSSFEKIDISASMKSVLLDSDVVKARILGFYLGVDSIGKLTDKSKIFFSATAAFEVGSNEVIGTIAEYEPEETIDLDQAGVIYKISENLEVEFGALSQGIYHSPLLVSEIPFAAFKQNFIKDGIFVSLQQAIPSNNYLAKRVGTIETGTPFFRLETLGYKYGNKNIFHLQISHFSYRDLSHNIAEKSQVFGNSVTGVGSGTKFLYGFDGYNITVNSSFVVSKLQLNLGGQLLYNDKAPEKRNRGALIVLGLKGKEYGVEVENFHNESDSSPSFYNSKVYGHNNMKGIALVGKFYGAEYLAKFRLSQLNPIEENSVQAREYLFSFQVGKIVNFL